MIHKKLDVIGDGVVVLPSDPWGDFSTPRSLLLVISPDKCREILSSRNKRNRTPVLAVQKRIASDLVNGKWKVNGETIIFSRDGQLLDGQNRLAAAVMADRPLRTWIVFGADPEAFDTIDSGKTRKGGDVLSIDGEKSTLILAAALALVWNEEQGTVARIGPTPPPSTLRDILARHPGIRDSVRYAGSHRIENLIQPRIVAYCHYRFNSKSVNDNYNFFCDLESGANLDTGDPVLVLRNRLIKVHSSRSKLPPRDVLALMIKAWNFRRSGQSIRNLIWKSDEQFPDIE